MRLIRDETRRELAIVARRRRSACRATARDCITNYIDLEGRERVATCSRSMCCSRKPGSTGPAITPTAAIMAVPLFETIGDLERAPAVMTALVRAARDRGGRRARAATGGDDRLFGLEQGWRLSHLGLEPQSGESTRSGRVFEQAGRRRCSCSTAAAARSGAAAARPSRRSARSRAARSQGRIRITEQGEVIAAKYGTRERRAGQSRGDGVRDLARQPRTRRSCRTPTRDALRRGDGRALATTAFQAYRALVYGTRRASAPSSAR